MNSGLRFFKQAVRMGLLDGARAREAYRESRQDDGTPEAYCERVGLLSADQCKQVVEALENGGAVAQPESAKSVLQNGVAGYRISSQLGVGGMGTVYQAEQIAMQRQVALKVLASQYARDAGFVQRFMREARAAGRVNDPHVVTCFDAGREGDTLYMALELVSGGDAHQLMERCGGYLSEERTLEIARDCAKGLAAIDKAGLVHRDIKPSNILIDSDGLAMLGDLGLARDMQEDDNISVSGEIFGTPAYMSPEHARGDQDLDIRTDIYSLGASLYTLLTGQQPFQGKSSLDVASKVLSAPVPDPRVVREDLSRATASLIMRTMSKDRVMRHQDPDELLKDVDAILSTGRLAEGAGGDDKLGSLSVLWQEGSAVVMPVGALGQNDAQMWNDVLAGVIDQRAQALIIDCTSVEWVSSEGLALLVRISSECTENGLQFGICNLNESTEKSIRIVQLHRILPLHETLEQALAGVKA